MCLTSKTNIPKIADKDIEVYKRIVVNLKRKCINHHYVYEVNFTTPYADIKIPKLPYEFIAEGKEGIIKYSDNSYEIREGFVHAYTNFLAVCCNIHWGWELIVKGIIPKDTEYYIGNESDICAKKIYLQGVVKVDKEDKLCKDIIKYRPDIPIFDIDSITFKQINSVISVETIKPIVEELVINKVISKELKQVEQLSKLKLNYYIYELYNRDKDFRSVCHR